MLVEKHWGGTDAVLVASVCCVVERPLEGLVLYQVLWPCRLWARVLGRRAEARSDRDIPGFLDPVLFKESPHIGGTVEAGTLMVCRCLGEAGLLRRREQPRYI